VAIWGRNDSPRRTIHVLDDWLTSSAHARPDHTAVVAEGRAVTYVELDAAASRAARRLAALGVGLGDLVATTLAPGHAFCELLHALPRLGAVLAPLDPRAPLRTNARLTVDAPLDGQEAEVELRRSADPNAVHSVIHTSGTAGRPKAVELTFANHHASALASADALGVEPDDRWLCPLPLFHVGGLGVLLRCAINGTTAVLHEGFDASRVAASLEAGEVTLASLVPTMLQRLRQTGLGRPPELRAIALGGGPIPAALIDWAVETGIPLTPVYGMTETASQIVAGIPGRPLRGVELRISRDGEILVRGPMVAPGAFATDGWLHTGDRGFLDERGLLHVVGRLKEIIVTGGENVSPLEVEEALLAHPAVTDAGVTGVPDPDWGETVTAFVVLRDGATAEELLVWCRSRLAPPKVPKRIEPVERLPRNAAGKLLRDRLV
jgi:o-succinylbenzoate---CoA ligase